MTAPGMEQQRHGLLCRSPPPSPSWKQLLLFLTILISNANLCLSEIRVFQGRLNATSDSVHYTEGYLIAPGYVNLSGLTFKTVDSLNSLTAPNHTDDDHFAGAGGKNSTHSVDDDDNTNGGGRRGRGLDSSSLTSTQLEIAFFHILDNCTQTQSGCDWTEYGVGASKPGNVSGESYVRWCCSGESINAGFCKGGDSEYGKLIINHTRFKGQHRFVDVPNVGNWNGTIKFGELEVSKDSGRYILIMSNCNDEGRDLDVSGYYTWKSSHGYLPGELFEEMYFYAVVTAIYFIAMLWYGISMRIYSGASIPIQSWILSTMALGLLENFFRTGDFVLWNIDGTRFWLAMYGGIILGVLKRAISRCLLVMVSLGWGVLHDSLGSVMNRIVLLGIVYVGFSSAQDIMAELAIKDFEMLSVDQGEELVNIVIILVFIVAAIDVTFYMWILDGLNNTMYHLEARNQNSKLMRYLRLRCILLFSILFEIIWIVYGITNNYTDDGILEEQHEWVVDAATEVNYLFVLMAVAILWRPTANAKEYAFVMELPALDSGEENELDLSATVVPSAHDEDDENGNGHDDGVHYRDDDDDDHDHENGRKLPDVA